jgi:hypothetical protein
MEGEGLRVTAVRRPGDVRVFEASPGEGEPVLRSLDEIQAPRPFLAHPGWQGRVEREPR